MNQKGNTTLIITIIVSLLLISGTGLGVYQWQKAAIDKQKTDNAKQVSDLQKQIDDLKKAETANSSSTPVAEAADWHIYKNTDYGFQLTFSDAWKGLTSKKLSNIGNSYSCTRKSIV